MTATVVSSTQTPWSGSRLAGRVIGAVSSRGVPSAVRMMPVTWTLVLPFCSEITRARTPSREIRNSLTVRPASQAGVRVTAGTVAPCGYAGGPVGEDLGGPLRSGSGRPDPVVPARTTDGTGWLRVVRALAGWPGTMEYRVSRPALRKAADCETGDSAGARGARAATDWMSGSGEILLFSYRTSSLLLTAIWRAGTFLFRTGGSTDAVVFDAHQVLVGPELDVDDIGLAAEGQGQLGLHPQPVLVGGVHEILGREIHLGRPGDNRHRFAGQFDA